MKVRILDNTWYEIDGVGVYPRLSVVMGSAGMPWLRAWEARVGVEEAERVRNHTADHGTLVHLITQAWDEGDSEGVLMLHRECPELVAPLQMWAEWVGRMVKKWVVVEHPVWSVKMGVAGTIDRVALLRGERSLTIVDIKTGTLTDDIGERLAGYRMMWNEMGRLVVGDAFKKVQRTLAVSIPRDGGSLSVKEYDPARYEKQFALRVSDYHELVQQ